MTAETYRALCLRQPWSNLVAAGVKSVELRRWESPHRGPLVVCAGRTVERHPNALRAAQRHKVSADSPVGVALCLVDLIDIDQSDGGVLSRADAKAACLRYPTDEDGFLDLIGLFCWRLANPRPLRPVSIKGQLGIFPISADKIVFA
jgi:hypothetical protein